MNKMFKLLVKEAVLEALNEFVNGGISTLSEGDDGSGNQNQSGIEDGGKEDGNKDNDKGSGTGNSGGGLNNGRPIPDVGVGTFGRR